jgi:two-component system, NtrC family, sensor kinase
MATRHPILHTAGALSDLQPTRSVKKPTHQRNPPCPTDAERVAAALDLVRGAERGALTRLAASLSHALGTPLNVIAGRAAMISMTEEDGGQTADNARIIEERVRAITHTIQQVLTFSRAGKPSADPHDLQAVAQRAAALLQPLADERGISLTVRAGPPLEASIAGGAVVEVLVLLASSALDQTELGACVEFGVARGSVEPPPSERGRASGGEHARFVIHCPSTVLPPECLSRVYEPWFEPTSAHAELLLDLAVAYGIAREHRGWVDASVAPGQGTTFTVNWPLND